MSTDYIYWGIQDTLIVYVFVMCICVFIVVMCIWINIYLSIYLNLLRTEKLLCDNRTLL